MLINSVKAEEWIKEKLKNDEERYIHSIGAREAAKKLAEDFGCDTQKAELAALLHDNAKCCKYEQLIKIIEENNFPIDEDIKNNRKIVHAYAGAFLAKKELGLEDENIFNAIMYHTTGRSNMSLLEKIVYLADKIETKTRPPEHFGKITSVLYETKSLDKAIMTSIDITIRSLLDRKLPINTQTIETWNCLIK